MSDIYAERCLRCLALYEDDNGEAMCENYGKEIHEIDYGICNPAEWGGYDE